MNEDTPKENALKLADGTKLIYLHEDGGRVTDTNVWLAPGEDNAVVVGQDVSAELAQAFVERGICAVHSAKTDDPAETEDADLGTGAEMNQDVDLETEPEPGQGLPDMPWLRSA